MANPKVMNSVVIARKGYVLILSNGATVVANLNKTTQTGDECFYTAIRSLKALRYQSGGAQWTESKAVGHKFYKEI